MAFYFNSSKRPGYFHLGQIFSRRFQKREISRDHHFKIHYHLLCLQGAYKVSWTFCTFLLNFTSALWIFRSIRWSSLYIGWRISYIKRIYAHKPMRCLRAQIVQLRHVSNARLFHRFAPIDRIHPKPVDMHSVNYYKDLLSERLFCHPVMGSQFNYFTILRWTIKIVPQPSGFLCPSVDTCIIDIHLAIN